MRFAPLHLLAAPYGPRESHTGADTLPNLSQESHRLHPVDELTKINILNDDKLNF
jgi:hypothetical protein